MTRQEVFTRLDEVFQDVFDNEEIHVSDETTAEDIEDWDSLEQVNIVVAIQDEFKIKFNIAEVNAMENVGEIVDFILEKIGA